MEDPSCNPRYPPVFMSESDARGSRGLGGRARLGVSGVPLPRLHSRCEGGGGYFQALRSTGVEVVELVHQVHLEKRRALRRELKEMTNTMRTVGHAAIVSIVIAIAPAHGHGPNWQPDLTIQQNYTLHRASSADP